MSTDPVFMKQAGQYYWYHNDHLGTPQVMTTSSGAVVWKAKYSSFGKAQVDTSSTVVNPFRLPGHYEDVETYLHYNYFRYYNPNSGRYIKIDPIGTEGGINLYVYVQGDPLNYFDVFGLEGEDCQSEPGLPLTDCVKNILAPYFPNLDLDAVEIHLFLPVGTPRHADGITYGKDIYINPNKYNQRSIEGIALLGHEVTHYSQYNRYFTYFGFYRDYIKDYRKNRKKGMNEYDAYRNIPFEIEAFDMQKRIHNNLKAIYGNNNPCQ